MLGLGLGVNRGGFVPSLPLLDTYTGAAAAYSLRKLRTAYTGSAIRVRRSSDNTEADIGFNADGTLNTTALLAHVGANNGFVTTWYDQSGNARNATQTIAANQPQIVSSGSVILENSKPTLNFDGVNDFLSNNTFSSNFLSNLYSITVSKINNTFAGVVYGFGNTATNNPIRYFGTTGVPGNTGKPFYQDRDDALTSNTAFVLAGIANVQHLAIAFSNYTNNRNIIVNSTDSNSNTDSLGTITLNTFAIGALLRTTNGLFLNGVCQELILYSSDQSANRSGFESNINAYYNIY